MTSIVDKYEDKIEGSNIIDGWIEFILWKIENSFLDVPYTGISYTWCNNRIEINSIYERIDKGLCTEEWKDQFPVH